MKVDIVRRNYVGAKRTTLAVSALIEKDGKILLVRRKLTKRSFPGYWGIPTGKVKVGERLVEALAREVREETNLKVKPLELYHICEEFHDDHHHLIFAFLTKLVGGEARAGSDVCEVKWLSPSYALKLKLQPVARKQIRAYLKLKEKGTRVI